MKKRVLGIDPGLHGAWAVVEYDGPFTTLSCVYDTPTYQRATGKARYAIMEPALATMLKTLLPLDQAHIEEPGSMPGQGVASMLAFGQAIGIARGMVTALGVPLSGHRPAQWKRVMKVPKANKDVARAMVCDLFPAHADTFRLKKHVDRAEAVLIALAGERINR